MSIDHQTAIRTNERTHATHVAAILATAIAAVPLPALAGAENDPGFTGPGVEYYVSTSGATALGAFTRANNGSPTSVPPQGTYSRNTFAVGGAQLRIGRTIYTPGTGQFFGIPNLNTSLPSYGPSLNNDRVVYQYLERGSVNGVNDLVNSNGLRLNNGVPINAALPPVPTANQPLWQNGNYLSNTSASNGGYTYAPQQHVRLAFSDVKFQQAFGVNGTATATARPTQAGYGLGRGAIGSSNFQQLSNASTVQGGVGASTYLRNDALAVVPFNIVANPGTGLARVTKEEGKWLSATGRLGNGANFNFATRDAGSGTRNQAANNLGVDPSWASGERDRISLAPTYNDVDPNGNVVSIQQGISEANPERSIRTGSLTPDLNEQRISPTLRFADKTGGSVLRSAVVSSRMGMGVLSAGDSRNSAGTALTTDTTAPLRALAIDFNNGHGFNQAKATRVTEGMYEMWSASQAITVSGSTGSGGTLQAAASNASGSIYGDQDDEQGLTGPGVTHAGIHRKFLNNITGSVANFGTAENNRTPADAILAAGFILPQIMGVDKQFDGDAQTTRVRSTTPPAGSSFSEQQIWQLTANTPSSSLATQLNWVDPSTQNGTLGVDASSTSGSRYTIYAPTNTLATGATNADKSISINARTVLAGDMNGDAVRDLGDTEAMALAYASPTAYLATGSAGPRNYNGAAVANTNVTVRPGGLLGAAQGNEGLIVLTDLNSDGNVIDNGVSGFTTQAVSRADVKYFLYGASVDTSAYNSTTSVTLNGATKTLTAIENRRENGVRLGQLRKNAAIDRFNTELDTYVGSVLNPTTGVAYTQDQVNVLKFDKFDANGDGTRDRADALYVDRNVGKNYTNFGDVLSTYDDLVAAELNDNNLISHTIAGAGSDGTGTSDFKLIRDALGTALTDGDASFDGIINVTDLGAIALSYGATFGAKWSTGDFNFDGQVNVADLGLISLNYGAGLGLTFEDARALWNHDLALFPNLVEAAAVPEPGTAALLGVASLAMLARRRRNAAREAGQ